MDGQQRLATTVMFLAAVRDKLSAMGEVERSSIIESDYLLKKDIKTLEAIPRLTLNADDNEFFQKRVLSSPNSADRGAQASKDSHKRIEDAARLIAARVAQIAATSGSYKALLEWVTYIGDSLRVIWVSVPEDADAFTIFETLNDRGLALAISDLLKNYLLNRAGDDRVSEVASRWAAMKSTLEAVTRDSADDSLLAYLRHLWLSMHGLTREKELYARIKGEIRTRKQAIDFAELLCSRARLYAAILSPSHDLWADFGEDAKRHMEILNMLGMVQIRPLLLAALAHLPVQEIRKAMPNMVSWCVRFIIVGGLGGGKIEQHYADKAQDISGGQIKTSAELSAAMRFVLPTDAQFETAFAVATVSKAYLARFYLRVLERAANGNRQPELIPNESADELTLEHIMPKNPSGTWASIPKELREAYVNRLGNLALLQQSINSTAGHDEFSDKRPAYAESPLLLTRALGSLQGWSTKEIESRQKDLAKLAVSAWPL